MSIKVGIMTHFLGTWAQINPRDTGIFQWIGHICHRLDVLHLHCIHIHVDNSYPSDRLGKTVRMLHHTIRGHSDICRWPDHMRHLEDRRKYVNTIHPRILPDKIPHTVVPYDQADKYIDRSLYRIEFRGHLEHNHMFPHNSLRIFLPDRDDHNKLHTNLSQRETGDNEFQQNPGLLSKYFTNYKHKFKATATETPVSKPCLLTVIFYL